MKLKNLPITGKLFLILGLFAAAFLTSGGIIFWSWWQIDRTNLHLVRHCYPVMNACAEAALDLAVVRSEFYRYLGQYEPSPHRVEEALAQARERLGWMMQQAHRPDRKAAFSRLLAHVQQFQEGLGQLARAQERGEVVQVGELSNRLLEIGASSYQAANKLKTELGEQVQADILSISDRFSQYLWQAALVAALCLGLGLGLVFLISLDLRQGLRFVTAGLEVYAREHREPFPLVERKDELGSLAGAFNQLAQDLIAQGKALRGSEENLKAFFELSPDFLFVLDERGVVVHANHTVLERLGYRQEEIEGKPVAELHPTNRREEAAAIVAEILAEKRHTCDLPLLTKDGSQIPVETRVSFGRWDDRPALFGVSRDITERNEAEAALRRAKEEWEATFDAVSDLIAILDSQHRFVRVNRAMAARLGVEPQDLIGRPCHEVVHHLGAVPEICPLTQLFRDGREHCVEIQEPGLGGDFLVTVSAHVRPRGEPGPRCPRGPQRDRA